MRKNLLLGLALASTLAVFGSITVASAAGQAGIGGGWSGHHSFGLLGGYSSQLNLTDAQQDSIKQIIKTSFTQNKPQRQALMQQRQAFAEMKPTDSGYQAAANSLAQAEASAAQARTLQRASIRAQIYSVLTSAQQAQLATNIANAQARRTQWQQFKAANPLPSTSNATSTPTTSGQ